MRVEKVAVGATYMSKWGNATATTQNMLINHELAIVFSDCSGTGLETWVAHIGAGCPLPDVAEKLKWGVWL